MKQAILAIDQGTTSSRAMVFSLSGKPVALSQIEHQQIYPQNGWVEHNPDEIWQNTLHAVTDATWQAGDNGFVPVTGGITNQRETIIAWNKNSGDVLHNAIVWQDKRTAEICRTVEAEYGDVIRRKTGLLVDAYFSASKMHWLLEHVAAVAAAAKAGELAFGTMDSFLLWRLTNGKVHATDITNASRTMLFDIHTKDWDEQLLEIWGVSKDALPKVLPNTADFGATAAGLLPYDLPIQSMAGDQQAAAVGQGCFETGTLKCTYGTGCFAMLNTGDIAVPSPNGLLTTILYQHAGRTVYALEGSLLAAGAVVQWLRDKLGIIAHAGETEALAQMSKDADDVYFVPAFAGLSAPYWDSEARAAISGITLDVTKADIVRAALDGVVLQTNDLMQAMEAGTGQPAVSLRVDGGMVVNNWFLQRLADVLNIPVIRPKVTETTALGAAYLAGLQHGLYQSFDTISDNWQTDREVSPAMDSDARQAMLAGWKQAVASVRS